MHPLVEIKDKHERPRAKWKEWVPAPVKRYGRGVADITLGIVGFFILLLMVPVAIFFIVLDVYEVSHPRRGANRTPIASATDRDDKNLALAARVLNILPALRRVNLRMVLIAIGISVYAVEITLMFMTLWLSLPSVIVERDQQARIKAAEASGKTFDTRSRMEVVRDLQRQGIGAYATASPLNFILDSNISSVEKQTNPRLSSTIRINGTEVFPLSGISRKVSVMCNESGEYTIFESDRYGFHNPDRVWASKGVDVVALGDSTTHGKCVSSDKDFTSLIRDRYPSTVNLGISGHGPLQMLATLFEYAAPLRPKVVLWFYSESNDLRDLSIESNYPLLMRYLTDNFSQGLIAKRDDLDAALKTYFDNHVEAQRSKLTEMAEILGDRQPKLATVGEILRLAQLRQEIGLTYPQVSKKKSVEAYGEVLSLFSKILLRADASVRAWGGQLYFVYLPEWEPFGNPENVDGRREGVIEMVKAFKLPLIDVYQTFRSHQDPLSLFPFRLDGHFNEEGHRLVAQEVVRFIQEN